LWRPASYLLSMLHTRSILFMHPDMNDHVYYIGPSSGVCFWFRCSLHILFRSSNTFHVDVCSCVACYEPNVGQCRAVAQAISLRLLTAEARVRARSSLCDLWWEEGHWVRVYSELFGFLLSFRRDSPLSYTGCSKSSFTEKPDIKTTYLLSIVLTKIVQHVCHSVRYTFGNVQLRN
jgi:hypothetical protein